MATHNTAVYDQQVAVPRRFTDPSQNWSKMRHYSIAPLTLDAAQDDVIYLIKVPAKTKFIPSQALLYHTALGALVTADVGWLGDTTLGITADPNGLADGLDVAAAGTKNPLTLQNTAANAMKELWEIVGLSAAPADDAMITLTIDLKGANPASGTIGLFLPCRARG